MIKIGLKDFDSTSGVSTSLNDLIYYYIKAFIILKSAFRLNDLHSTPSDIPVAEPPETLPEPIPEPVIERSRNGVEG